MGVNKVVFGTETIMDLTGDTVTPETLAEGVTAHDASGEQITGTLKGVTVTDDGNGNVVITGLNVTVG